MKTNTDYITVGKNPFLTYAIIKAIAARHERNQKRKALIDKLKFWKR